MPHGKHFDLVDARYVVDVIASSIEQNATRAWFGPAGSPALAQLVQDCCCRAKTARLSRFPGYRKRVVQRAALRVGEVITFVISNQLNHHPVG